MASTQILSIHDYNHDADEYCDAHQHICDIIPKRWTSLT